MPEAATSSSRLASSWRLRSSATTITPPTTASMRDSRNAKPSAWLSLTGRLIIRWRSRPAPEARSRRHERCGSGAGDPPASSLPRSRMTCTSITFDSPPKSDVQTRSKIASREKTWRGLRIRNSSRSNSRTREIDGRRRRATPLASRGSAGGRRTRATPRRPARLRRAASQQRAHPSQQLVEREGLDEIVVCRRRRGPRPDRAPGRLR